MLKIKIRIEILVQNSNYIGPYSKDIGPKSLFVPKDLKLVFTRNIGSVWETDFKIGFLVQTKAIKCLHKNNAIRLIFSFYTYTIK